MQRPGAVPLEQQVDETIQGIANKEFRDPHIDAGLQRFDDVRQQIRQAAEDRQLIEWFLKVQPVGGIN
jgi:hypothetical protein